MEEIIGFELEVTLMNRQAASLLHGNQNPPSPLSSKERGQNPIPDRQNRLRKFILLQTKSAMTKDVLTIGPQMTLRELEHLFETHDFNGLPVVKGRHLIGIVTKFDFLKSFIFTPGSVFPHYDELMKRTVEEIMTREICTVHPDTPLTRVLQMMVEMKNKSFPVVDGKNRLLGMISRSDLVRAMNGQ